MKTLFYPTQLDDFKNIVELIFEDLQKLSAHYKLSAFKKFDSVAMAFGHKGHSDLIKTAKFHHQADDVSAVKLPSVKTFSEALHNVLKKHLNQITLREVGFAVGKTFNFYQQINSFVKEPEFLLDGVESMKIVGREDLAAVFQNSLDSVMMDSHVKLYEQQTKVVDDEECNFDAEQELGQLFNRLKS